MSDRRGPRQKSGFMYRHDPLDSPQVSSLAFADNLVRIFRCVCNKNKTGN